MHKTGVCIMDKTLSTILSLIGDERGAKAKFSKALNLPSSALGDWQNGRNKSYLKKLSEIANYFNVSVDYLLGATNAREEDSIEKEKRLDQQLEGIDFALYGEAKDLTYEQKLDVIDYIRFKKQKEK